MRAGFALICVKKQLQFAASLLPVVSVFHH